MVRHTLKVLQSVSDHFEKLCIKGLTFSMTLKNHRNIKTQGITTAETSLIKLDGFY